MTDKYNVSVTIKAIDKLTAPIKQMTKRVNEFGKSVDKNIKQVEKITESGFAKFARNATKGVIATGGALTATSLGFASVFTNTAAEFERFETILKTVEGSSDKAKQSMKWVEDFATKTPYELSQVTDSFVRLKSYGLDPMQGDLLKTLGDTASAMGKPITQAVEAIADAVTGENERLKEFGIKARAEGDLFVYEFTDEKGVQRTLEAAKDSRAEIQRVLQSIMNRKYANAMQDQMKTWNGMMSNLADHWTRFQNMVMKAGLFDWMKNKLQGFLDKINEMAENGELQKWAEKVSEKIITFLNNAWDVGKALISVIGSLVNIMVPIANIIAEWSGLFRGLLSLGIAVSIASWTKAVIGLGMAFYAVTGPIGVVVAGVTALVALLVSNWDKITKWFGFNDDEQKTPVARQTTSNMLGDVLKRQQKQHINNQTTNKQAVTQTNTFNFTARNASDVEEGVRRAMGGEYLGDLATEY